jgi:hypothetical protein
MRTREQLELIDIDEDVVDTFTTEEEDLFIEICRERTTRIKPNAKPPCPCYFCDNWVDINELYYIIGYLNDKILCSPCAQFTFEKEDEK